MLYILQISNANVSIYSVFVKLIIVNGLSISARTSEYHNNKLKISIFVSFSFLFRMIKKTILVWFRNDLRISDNEMLSFASDKGNAILPVFIYDTRAYAETNYGTRKTGILRAKFINESVQDLQRSIRSLNGELIIERGLPEEILPELARQYQIDEVYHHREVAYEETKVSALVEEALWKLQLNLRHFIGHTLYHKEDLPFPIKDIPDDFNTFKKKVSRERSIRPSIKFPENLSFLEITDQWNVPELKDLGYNDNEIELAATSGILGGEIEAKRQLTLLLCGDVVESRLSPWISLGCLSVHTYYHSLVSCIDYPKAVLNKLMDELWWHDYYRFMFKKHGNQFFKLKGFSKAEPSYSGGDDLFESWKSGNTDNMQVNSIMKTLNRTGYISHAERVKVAVYLVNDLQISWLKGAAYFEDKLIDYNPATNYGSWAHIAGVGSSFKNNLKNIS